MRMPFPILAILIAMSAPAVPAEPPELAPREKKLIQTGWDHPDSARLRANLSAMEKRPFDGVVVQLVGRDGEGGRVPMRQTFSGATWQAEWFAHCVENLRACRSKRLTDNFALVGANPGDVDFFDDAGWRAIVRHWALAAGVARRGGLKGLLFDPEPYTPPHRAFDYRSQPGRDEHTFSAYAAQARRRGGDVMRAVAAEYPDITLFCYFLNSVVVRATGRQDAAGALAGMHYGLLPAFLDGMLDAAGPEATFVDGCEAAYRYNSVREYLEAAVAVKGACQQLVSGANRRAYRAQVQVSFGLYLDAYWNPADSRWSSWYIDGLGGPRVDRLAANARTALRVADEYVWVYGEKFRWWPTPNPRVRRQSWPEALPGCEQALALARDPIAYARRRLAEMGEKAQAANLARNGDFSAEAVELPDGRTATWRQGPPAGWSAWQASGSEGSFTWDRRAGATGPGSARASGAAEGCFLQKVAVRPGELLAVAVRRRLTGRGRTWLHARWQTADDAWTAQSHDRRFQARGPRDQWREAFTVVEVPEGVGKFVLLLGVSGQASDEDVAWFDDVGIYRLRQAAARPSCRPRDPGRRPSRRRRRSAAAAAARAKATAAVGSGSSGGGGVRPRERLSRR